MLLLFAFRFYSARIRVFYIPHSTNIVFMFERVNIFEPRRAADKCLCELCLQRRAIGIADVCVLSLNKHEIFNKLLLFIKYQNARGI